MDRARENEPQEIDVLDVFGRWYEAHESGDLAGLAAVLAEDARVHSLFRPEPVRGREDAVAHFLGVTSTFDDLRMSLAHTPACADGRVLVEVEFSGAFTGRFTWDGVTTRGAGQRFTVPGVAVVEVEDAWVVSVRTVFDRDDWLRQIGVGSAASESHHGARP